MTRVDSPIKGLEWRDLEDLSPNPNNPRIHPDSAIAKIRESIDFFGFVNPILILEDGRMIAGHARRKAVSEEIDGEEVPCLVLDMSFEEAESYMLADNRTQEEADWDDDKLTGMLKEISEFDIDESSTGFDEDEIEEIMADFNEEVEQKEDLSDEIVEEYQVVVECENEQEQERLYNELTSEGYECQVLTL